MEWVAPFKVYGNAIPLSNHDPFHALPRYNPSNEIAVSIKLYYNMS